MDDFLYKITQNFIKIKIKTMPKLTCISVLNFLVLRVVIVKLRVTVRTIN